MKALRILFEDDLVEAALSLSTSGRVPGTPARDLRRFHAERERCYAVHDADERAAAFAAVQRAWFGSWGLRARLEEPLASFPVLSRSLMEFVFRRSRGHDEGAELYVDAEGRRRGVLALRPDRLGEAGTLPGFLHHELGHLADMLDPEFGYAVDFTLPGGRRTSCQVRLVCARYRLLWSIRVDGELARRGLPAAAGVEVRRRELDRGFGFLPETRREEIFRDLWEGRLGRHGDLLSLADDPRHLGGQHAPIPGAPCSLCGFPAFQWTEGAAMRPQARARVRAEFPGWTESDPVCARCAEIYDSITGMEYPATVVI